MRLLLLISVVGLAGGCASSVRQQTRTVAHYLSISEDTVGAMVREAGENRAMKVEWVRKTADAAVEIGLKPDGAYHARGIVAVFRHSNGRWMEDVESRRSWSPDKGPIGPIDRDPIVYPHPPRENP